MGRYNKEKKQLLTSLQVNKKLAFLKTRNNSSS